MKKVKFSSYNRVLHINTSCKISLYYQYILGSKLMCEVFCANKLSIVFVPAKVMEINVKDYGVNVNNKNN